MTKLPSLASPNSKFSKPNQKKPLKPAVGRSEKWFKTNRMKKAFIELKIAGGEFKHYKRYISFKIYNFFNLYDMESYESDLYNISQRNLINSILKTYF